MFKHILSTTTGVLLLVFAWLLPLQAQEAVVYGVFFYSPTCPHCQDVINNHWPAIQQEFGDQLQILFINAAGSEGAQIMQQARTALHIEAQGVPMLIIGSEVMVGSVDIPQRAPDVIRTGLAAGGVALPPIPGIEELYQLAVEYFEGDQGTGSENGAAPSPEPIENLSLTERFQTDPVANTVAVVVLMLLVSSLLLILAGGWRSLVQHDPGLLQAIGTRMGRTVLLLLALMGGTMTVSLIAGSNNDTVVMLLAGVELTIFVVLIIALTRKQPLPAWLLPAAALAGLGAAAYLAYIEVTMTEVVCGMVGNCNLVQQSPYARVLGIPIGVIGVIGYVSMMVIWGITRRNHRLVWLRQMLVVMALFGAAFSAYLTFLEPFVIGASCIWCLTSAVIMLMLLWIVVMMMLENGM